MPKTPIPFPLTDDSHATTFMIGSRLYAINIPTRYPDQKRTPAEVFRLTSCRTTLRETSPMRTDWKRSPAALEHSLVPVPEGLPAVVYGLREDGKRCFLWAGW